MEWAAAKLFSFCWVSSFATFQPTSVLFSAWWACMFLHDGNYGGGSDVSQRRIQKTTQGRVGSWCSWEGQLIGRFVTECELQEWEWEKGGKGAKVCVQSRYTHKPGLALPPAYVLLSFITCQNPFLSAAVIHNTPVCALYLRNKSGDILYFCYE